MKFWSISITFEVIWWKSYLLYILPFLQFLVFLNIENKIKNTKISPH